MNKTVLLAASAVLALTAGSALAGPTPSVAVKATPVAPIQSPGGTLYNQNSNFSNSIVSDNFTSGTFGTIYNSAAADDFVVPMGKTWKVTGVDVTGVYSNCTQGVNCGPATSEIVTFYKDAKGMPGKVVGTPQTLNCTDSAGTFACKVSAKLKGGTSKKGQRYWLAFVANQNFGTAREWYWTENTTIHGNQAEWENPGGGFGVGCTTWGQIGTCLGSTYTGDYAFDLKGKSS
jgi:hypothetical protein